MNGQNGRPDSHFYPKSSVLTTLVEQANIFLANEGKEKSCMLLDPIDLVDNVG
jgi:hypothetical protein